VVEHYSPLIERSYVTSRLVSRALVHSILARELSKEATAVPTFFKCSPAPLWDEGRFVNVLILTQGGYEKAQRE
jgi:hypothetical protein